MASDDDRVTVFYDGACPLCRREIAFYRRQQGAEAVHWVDVADADSGDVAPGLTLQQARERFHLRDRGGRLTSGAPAFARLWMSLPAFRVLGRLVQTWPLSWLAARAYDGFLVLRPWLQNKLARRNAQTDRHMPNWLVRDLRSDHAGETGAVAIYQGVLAVTKDSDLRRFCELHIKTERRHLELIEGILEPSAQSSFTALWRLAGFLTGAIPAAFGSGAVFATVDAVETFVDRHYARQVARLRRENIRDDIYDILEKCRYDEVRHRDEARERLGGSPGVVTRMWCWLVEVSSAGAVAVARRI